MMQSINIHPCPEQGHEVESAYRVDAFGGCGLCENEIKVRNVEPQHKCLELGGPLNVNSRGEIGCNLQRERERKRGARTMSQNGGLWPFLHLASARYLDKAEEDLQLVSEVRFGKRWA